MADALNGENHGRDSRSADHKEGEMRIRVALLLAVLCLGVALPALAQQSGEIYGKVNDTSGAVMPGVTLNFVVIVTARVAGSACTATWLNGSSNA